MGPNPLDQIKTGDRFTIGNADVPEWAKGWWKVIAVKKYKIEVIKDKS
jgi:hypothetical protein